MRIDLTTGGQRPLFARLTLGFAHWYVGVDSGPPTALSFRPDLFGPPIRQYIMRAARASPSWDKGHVEMFSAFVSKLNSCSF